MSDAQSFDESQLLYALDANARSTNYLRWLADLCLPHLGDRCLEIGSGFGTLTERFAPGREVIATDLSSACLAELHRRFDTVSNVSVRELDLEAYEPTGETFDSIVMMNVLEHIEHDGGALDRLYRSLDPGGRLVVYVPAFMLLMSRYDRMIGHHRRYRKQPLKKLMEASGFTIVDARYVNTLGAIGWFIYCRLLRRDADDEMTRKGCDRYAVPIVRFVEDRVPPPFGLSLLCVGERT